MEEQSVTSDSSSACEFPPPIPAAYTSITATYSVIQRQYTLETQAYIGYGIKIVPSENIAPFEIEDITTSETSLNDLVAKCNSLSLDPKHIYDIIQDFL